jgi:hypothetical protein
MKHQANLTANQRSEDKRFHLIKPFARVFAHVIAPNAAVQPAPRFRGDRLQPLVG